MGKVAFLLSGRIFATLQSFLVSALIVRTASEADAAAYLYCFTVASLVQFFGLASIEPMLIKSVNEAREHGRGHIDLSAYMYAMAGLVMLPMLVAVLYFALQPSRPEALQTFFFAMIWCASTWVMAPVVFLRAKLELTTETRLSLIIGVLFLVLKIVHVVLHLPIQYIFLLYAIENVALAGLCALDRGAKGGRFFGPASVGDVVNLMRAAAPYVASVGILHVYARTALLIMTPSMTNAEVVLVGVIGQLITAGALLSHSLQQLIYPVQQRATGDDSRFRLLLQGISAVCVCLSVAIGLALMGVGDWLVHLVYVNVAHIPLIAFGFIGMHLALQMLVNARNNAIMARDGAREVAMLNAVALVLAIGAALALKPFASVISFTAALALGSFLGLAAGYISPIGRALSPELWRWASPAGVVRGLQAVRTGLTDSR